MISRFLTVDVEHIKEIVRETIDKAREEGETDARSIKARILNALDEYFDEKESSR